MKTTSITKTSSNASLNTVDIFNVYNSNCLKGIAIIMLIIHHCFLSPKRYAGQTLTFLIPEGYINYVALFFKICVCLFAFISAYGITKKMMTVPVTDTKNLQISIKNIITSRIVKLLGSFIFVFLLVDLFALFYEPSRFAEVYGSAFPDAIANFVLDALGLAEILGTPTFLGTYWYYSLAIILIIVCPLMYLLAKKIGAFPFLALMAVINFTFAFGNRNIWHYVLCISTGVVCAMGNTITKLVYYKISRNPVTNGILKFATEAALLFILMILRESSLKGELYPFWDAVIPVAMTVFCCEFIFRIPVIKEILLFLGKYSANIFLVHNYIRNVWFYDFTYSFKYPVLIVTVLLGISLVLSLLIELLKKILHYNQFINKIVKLIETKPEQAASH